MTIGLRTRLTIVFTVAMAFVVVALGAFLYLRLASGLLAAVDFDLRSRAQPILAALPSSTSFAQPHDGLIDPDEAFAQILDSSGGIVETTPGVADAPLIGIGTARTLSAPTFFTRGIAGLDDPARLLAIPATEGDRRVVVVIGGTLGDRNDALHRLLVLLSIAGPILVAVAAAGAWLLAGGALRPVERMRREADAISLSELDRRLGIPATGDELDRLASTLNRLLDRLQEAVDRDRRFVDDASHELRTPLAILKSELELATSKPRERGELERALVSAAIETDRLVALAEDLLVLARTRDGSLPLRREHASLWQLVKDACGPLESRQGSPGAIEYEVSDEQVDLDIVRVRQAISNLVDNALRHGRAPVHVRAWRDGPAVRFEIADRGAGFAPDMIDRAFDPFATGPTSDGTGSGLGLAIVEAVADAHGGTVTARNTSEGAIVTLVLPTF